MSEVQKPVVEEQPVAVVDVAPAVEPVPEVKEDAPVSSDAPAVDAAPISTEAETKPETPKKEFEGEGVLGYKAPGGFIKKLAGFQKRFFWFGTDAVEVKSLSNYLRGEKPEVGNHNAAWSSQTGKGLLYFSKHATEQSAPVGLINLADITDIKEDGTVDFSFVSHGQKHVFQTNSLVDRENWVTALKSKSAEAKESAESITNSDGYKEQLASVSKPTVVAPVVAPVVAKAEEKKEEAVVEEKKAETKEDKKVETKEEKKARTKSRSASRKRNSIFGGFNLGSKKEDAADKVEGKDNTAAPVPASEAAVIETPEVVVENPEEAIVENPEAVVETPPTEESRPAASKRHSSLFDFKSRFGSKKASTEAVPVVPAKDEEVVTSTEAPVIPAVEQSEPLGASIASPATVPTEAVSGEPAVEAAEVKTENKTEVKSDKRKSSLPFGLGQKKEKSPEVEGEKPLSPFAKLRQTVKHKTSPKTAEKAPEKSEDQAEVPATDAKPETDESVTPAPIQPSTPVVSATA